MFINNLEIAFLCLQGLTQSAFEDPIDIKRSLAIFEHSDFVTQ